jgi:hypothetical protein
MVPVAPGTIGLGVVKVPPHIKLSILELAAETNKEVLLLPAVKFIVPTTLLPHIPLPRSVGAEKLHNQGELSIT